MWVDGDGLLRWVDGMGCLGGLLGWVVDMG